MDSCTAFLESFWDRVGLKDLPLAYKEAAVRFVYKYYTPKKFRSYRNHQEFLTEAKSLDDLNEVLSKANPSMFMIKLFPSSAETQRFSHEVIDGYRIVCVKFRSCAILYGKVPNLERFRFRVPVANIETQLNQPEETPIIGNTQNQEDSFTNAPSLEFFF